ncbi:MAG TPA: hypothetical protein VMX17_02690 [Candidatus Glassbacteria bacterium]|nr:hypothetical protein [Candidatus Glassbacteria bacterium]
MNIRAVEVLLDYYKRYEDMKVIIEADRKVYTSPYYSSYSYKDFMNTQLRTIINLQQDIMARMHELSKPEKK